MPAIAQVEIWFDDEISASTYHAKKFMVDIERAREQLALWKQDKLDDMHVLAGGYHPGFHYIDHELEKIIAAVDNGAANGSTLGHHHDKYSMYDTEDEAAAVAPLAPDAKPTHFFDIVANK